jgi:hypothetical protein
LHSKGDWAATPLYDQVTAPHKIAAGCTHLSQHGGV